MSAQVERRCVPHDALGVALAIVPLTARIYEGISSEPGLFSDAVVVSHSLWDGESAATLLHHRWKFSDGLPFVLERSLQYDQSRPVRPALSTRASVLVDNVIPFVESSGAASLDLNGCYAMNDDVLSKCAQTLPLLLCLDLSGCRRLTDAGIQRLPHFAPNVTQLSLRCSRAITDEVAGPLGLLSSLTSLDLSGCPRLTAEMGEAFRTLPVLEFLDLSEVPIEDSTLVRIGSTALSDLRVSGCVELTVKGFEQCSTTFVPHLMTLDISGCKGLEAGFASYIAPFMKKLTVLVTGNRVANPLSRCEPQVYFSPSRCTTYNSVPAWSDSDWAAVSELSQLTSLDVCKRSDLTGDCLQRIALMPNLTSLNCTMSSNCGSGLAHLSAATTLTSLDLSRMSSLDATMGDTLGVLTALRHLNLAHCSNADDRIVLSLKTLTHLEDLNLHGLKRVRTFPPISHMPNLEMLDCGECEALDSPTIYEEFSNGGGMCLKRLDLRDAAKLHDDVVEIISAKCEGLMHINIGNCSDLTNKSVHHLSKLNCVKTLTMSQCGRLTHSCIQDLRNFPALESLDLRETRISCVQLKDLQAHDVAADSYRKCCAVYGDH